MHALLRQEREYPVEGRMPLVDDTDLGKIQEILVQRFNHPTIVLAGIEKAESFTQLHQQGVNVLLSLRQGGDLQ